MKKNIAVLPGDGIGKEVIAQAVKVLKAIAEVFDHEFIFDYGLVGATAIDATGDPFPAATETLCKQSDSILFGAIGDPKYDNDPSAKVRPEQGLLRMREILGLFSNVRPVVSYPLLYSQSPLKDHLLHDVDFVVFRELTGGIYFGKPSGRSEDGEQAFDTCLYSKKEIIRIAKMAFEAAATRKNKVTMVDKANVLATSRLWRETVAEVAKDYPEVELEFMFVDNAAMKIILQPAYFDVILTENLFGDILTDEASVIAGSLGLIPSASLGNQYKLYEPVHGSFPQAAGKDLANPIAAILSAAMMLEMSFGAKTESRMITEAVKDAMDKGYVTQDINNSRYYSTTEVGDAIVSSIQSGEMVDFEAETII
ncbi:MAG: 3-isopropylmalate dehydrogenase [Cyclobacteriaceae bacterium]